MNIEYRLTTPSMVICKWVSRKEIPQALPPLIRTVREWLKKNNTDPSGSPFFEYRVMSGERMHVCVGFPVRQAVTGDDTVHAGAFPEGEYATNIHTGSYHGLFSAHQALNEWCGTQGYRQRFLENIGAVCSGSRTEFYLTDPATDPDETKWRTEIAVWVNKSAD